MSFLLLFSVILPINAEVDSPRKQMERGILVENVQCKSGLELIIRTNGNPACVTLQTAEKMKEMGIATIPIKFTDLIKNETVTPTESKIETIIPTENKIETIPASSKSIVNFYVTDHDLNLAHNGVEVVSTEGLFEFTINGTPINGPKSMIETGPNTGKFYVKLELPETVNGKQLNQDDIVLMKYLDESDYSGNSKNTTISIPLSKTYANVETVGGSSRIGHEFIVRIYEPDANRDSKNEDKISLSKLEFRGEDGIRTTLANPKFDANRSYLVETGPNTNTFEVVIKIPREIDGKTIHIGDEYEIRYIDTSTPSNSNEKIILKGKIG